jgi:hypothetical protein
MRVILLALAGALLWCTGGPANAEKFTITKKNAFVFDIPLAFGQKIEVYVPRRGEPWNDDVENDEHDQMSLAGLLDADPRISGTPITIARAYKVRNAFAFIYKGERFIAFDPALAGGWSGTPSWTLTFAHELGHHICGHQDGAMQGNPWGRELEADRFSGSMVHLVEHDFRLTLDAVLQNARQIYATHGSPTHPPQSMRLAAIVEGYNKGSPCVDRLPIPVQMKTMWNHDGSLMSLTVKRKTWFMRFERPRQGLSSLIQLGDTQFQGTKTGHSYEVRIG